jgi:hypothetical protein
VVSCEEPQAETTEEISRTSAIGRSARTMLPAMSGVRRAGETSFSGVALVWRTADTSRRKYRLAVVC